MPTLLESGLDEYSRQVASLILARFPEWEACARPEEREDGLGSTVQFQVPCPSATLEQGLWVWTGDEELEVGFHTHQRHYTDYEDRLNPEVMEAGVQQIVDVVEERSGVASYYRDGGFAGSRWVELPHERPLPGLFEGFPNAEALGLTSEYDRVTLRTWLGTFDRDEVRDGS
jgi:hypothetical protein